MSKGNITEEWLSELKSKTDIVGVISRSVALNFKGGRYWGCCPFHGEKTPSFTVNARDKFYYCFGCHKGGDVINFVQEKENTDFYGALEILAEYAGMTMPERSESDGAAAVDAKKKARLYDLMKEAARRYHSNLVDEKIGAAARAYLKERGITREVATHFGMGYSASYDDLIVYLTGLGYTEDEMVAAGAAMRSESGRTYDACAERLIVPIIDARERIIGFGGRIIVKDDTKAKYRNTQASAIFVKNKELFGVNQIKRLRKKTNITVNEVILVEGYMDVISLYGVGVTNVVAGMGTALGKGQARAVKTTVGADKVYVCYDGDNAGRKATLSNIDILAAEGLEVYVVSLPDGMDPDDAAKKLGTAGVRKLIDAALPMIDYKLKLVSEQYDLTTANGKAGYVKAAIEVLQSIVNTAEREVYFTVVADKSGISVENLRKQFSGEAVVTVPERVVKDTAATPDSAAVKAADFVLKCLLSGALYASSADVKKEWLLNESQATIYEYVTSREAEGKTPTTDGLFSYTETTPDLMSVLNTDTEGLGGKDAANRYYADSVKLLARSYAAERIKSAMTEYSAAEAADKERLGAEIKDLQKLLRLK